MVCRQVTCHFPRCLTCTLHMVMVLCLVSTTRGLHKAEAQGTVEIYPQEPTIEVGQALTLTCEVTHPNVISAVDIQWSHDGVALSSKLYSALDTKRSRLMIPQAGFRDSGLYACKTEKSAQQASNSTEVNVGDPPSAAKDLKCFSRDSFDITCEWTPGSDTNIPTTDYLFYSSRNNLEWELCRNFLPGNTSCVKEEVHETYYFYVLSVNRLGNASTETILFDYETETVSNPPKNVRVKPTPQSRLHIEWDLPEEWRSFYKNQLQYKIEYFNDRSPTVSMEFPGSLSEEPLKELEAELPFPQYLDAYSIYCVKVTARKTECPWSNWSETVCCRTLEQNPDAKLNMTFSSSVSERNESLRHIVLEWEPLPLENRRGIIIGYNVMNVTIIQRAVITNVTLNASQTSLEIYDLERFQKYKFAIEAFNSAGASPRTVIDIPEEHPQYLSSAIVNVVAVVGVLVIFTLIGLSWYCIKCLRIFKPVPSIYFIAPEQFERILDGRVPRRAIEREVFDLPSNHRTPNGVIPNGILGNSHLSSPCAEEGGCVADHGEADYVELREETSKDSDPLLCEVDSCRKLSRTSTDSANSSEGLHEKDPLSPGSTTGGSGKLSALFVHLPGSASIERLHTCSGRSVLDSIDSGYGENCTENRVPSYLKLSSIQSDAGLMEVPPSAEYDAENDEDGGGDVYHRLGTGEAIGSDSDLSLSQSQPCIYSEETMPSYTRLVAIPGPLSNGVAPSLDAQEHSYPMNGHLLNRTAPSFDNHGPGST